MLIFKYKAQTREGRKISDLINAYNEQEALENLKKRGLERISLSDKTDSLEFKILTSINRVTTKDLVGFSRQFAVMVSANLPLVQSLRIIAEQSKNITLKIIFSEIAREVDSGSRLSEALVKRPKVFSKFYTSVVRSGETSGRLDEVLTYLADEMERNYDMVSKIKGAMIYPVVIFLGLIAIGVFVMMVIIPQLTESLIAGGATLPLSTRIVIGTSNFLISYWLVLLVIVVALVIFFKVIQKNELGGYYIDVIKLKIPIFGKLFHYIYIVHFSRSMATLISGGVQVTKSLEVVRDVVDNKVYQRLIDEATEKVKEGDTISSVFMRSPEIPKMVSQMISVGERTGKTDMILNRISKFYERELSNMTNNLMSLLEPFIIIFMGIAVGIMVAAVFLPMYNVANQI